MPRAINWSSCWPKPGRRLLGIPQIGIHQNFFQIGGNSLMSLQVVTKIQEAGYQVSPQMLLENQTIATLAAAIAPALSLMAQAASPRHPDMAKTTTAASLRPRLDVKRFADTFERKPPIVCLQAGSPEKTPLFLVPPANGNLFAYRRLVNHLNDETQPVYALMAVYENIMTADRLTAACPSISGSDEIRAA
ncbi:MAG: phosphopantetheine-binding protein [Chloroflexi bacterium]|nr:phosphopantetheine-binding protein [Chloroflexota bacterium]